MSAPAVEVPQTPAAPAGKSGPLSPRNWRVRTRLNAILLLPVLVALVFGGFRVQSSISTWSEAQDAERTARLVRAAAVYGNALINERDVSAAPLLSGSDKEAVRQVRTATDRAAEEFHRRAEDMPDQPGLQRRLKALQKVEPRLETLRRTAYTAKLGGVKTEEGYVAIQHPLMEFANELGLGTGNITSYGRTVYALSLAKSAESLQRSLGTHLLVKPGPSAADRRTQLTALASYAYLERIARDEFTSGSLPEDIVRLEDALADAKKERELRITRARQSAEDDGRKFSTPPTMEGMRAAIASPSATPEGLKARGITARTWFDAATDRFDAYRGVEAELSDKAVDEAAQISSDARRDAILNSAIVLVALLAAFVIAGLMARSMSRSMRQLRNAAHGVAEQRLPALVAQLSRTEPGRVDTRVQPIPISTQDEIGEVARAFDQVHREAVRLAAEQAMLRGNVNAIFTNLSSRNQGLIERQLTLITHLENNEADPDQLANLFKLDHLATRMRRNGENLLILAGEEPGRRWTQPVPLIDVLRAASSEVENYERIVITGVPESEIHGQAVNDLVHLLAELLENATTFSSPQTKVRVAATRLPDGRVMIEIHDKGIGLTAEDFADINHKLANPPTVDAAISQRMGLFVVGRLADRHGIRVQLRPSGEQAGTTSLVMLPDAITHGGGGEELSQDDFTVSRIVPEQPHATQVGPGLRTAAELGFDDNRYGAAQPSAQPAPGEGPEPVGRSLGRDGLRTPMGAPEHRQPEHPEAEYQGPAESGQQPYYDYNSPAEQGGWSETGSYQAPYAASYGSQPEPGPGVPEGTSDGVEFHHPGPSPSDTHSLTDSGLPRRAKQWSQPEEGAAQAAPSPRPASERQSAGPGAAAEESWSSVNDERWHRAEELREPKAGGITSSGLPRRVPKANLVEGAALSSPQDGPQVSRAPEDVRGRLSNLRRGVQQARNAGTDSGTSQDQHDRPGFGPGSTYDQER
ncbi:HAMP domain-containing protein [Streptomyces palmae]|uniref:histidine kinase n=2 Tax=Streptomyces palmae TaxID=1701085 RepID=A0A4Z0HFN5_9ACTN|nr:HAMP domain-containing protein [Streptomyces palmae]